MKRIVNALGNILVLSATAAMTLPGQTFTVLFNFDTTDGQYPEAALVQGTDGNLYGTTTYGGAAGPDFHFGTAYKITPGGTLTTLHVFCSPSGCADGKYPEAGLVQGTEGGFYGTASQGGITARGNGGGTVFKITPAGTLTTLYTFCAQSGCPDGDLVTAGVFQAPDGDFYGTTASGGANLGGIPNGGGTVFKITPSATLTTLYSFCSQSGCPDGSSPNGLVQAANGDFYGTNINGGSFGSGTAFKITPGGALTTLYSFCSLSGCTDGANPYAGLIQAPDRDFYGTTFSGGANNYGTVFKITPSGILTTLHSFCSQGGVPLCLDGANPEAALIRATDGNFYGTTPVGGVFGSIFKITPSGTLTTLHSFGGRDGNGPRAPLVQATNGDFYGTAQEGGIGGCTDVTPVGCGTVFRLSVGLGPFVKTLPHAGKVGTAISILGTDLTGATSVSFDRTPAKFTVASATEITATVPAGATTGKIQVVSPAGTLLSDGPFLVLP